MATMQPATIVAPQMAPATATAAIHYSYIYDQTSVRYDQSTISYNYSTYRGNMVATVISAATMKGA